MYRKMFFTLALFLLVSNSIALALGEYWKSLDGPYWAKGIDVAARFFNGNPTRFLIGSDGNGNKMFRWRPGEPRWSEWLIPDVIPNKVISYRNGDYNGRFAYCTVPGGFIYFSINAGLFWSYYPSRPTNQNYSAIEINKDAPGSQIFIGCTASQGQASAFQTTNGGQNWPPIGNSGLSGIDLNDLEYVSESGAGFLIAGTSSGIRRIQLTPPSQDWTQAQFFGNPITALEALDYNYASWAATGGTNKRLYYSINSYPASPWTSFQVINWPGTQNPFSKDVNDIAAVRCVINNADYQSVYIAAQDGLYLIDVQGIHEAAFNIRHIYSVGIDFPLTHLAYDFPVLSVDYVDIDIYTKKVLVGTVNNVYEILETRSGTNNDIALSISDLSKGTYIANVVSVAYPTNSGSDKVFALTDNGLIKKANLEPGNWSFTGIAAPAGNLLYRYSEWAIQVGWTWSRMAITSIMPGVEHFMILPEIGILII